MNRDTFIQLIEAAATWCKREKTEDCRTCPHRDICFFIQEKPKKPRRDLSKAPS